MKRVIQLLLIPFWVTGFTVGVIVVAILVLWRAGKAGYDDITRWVEGLSHVETD